MTRVAFMAVLSARRQDADLYHFHDPELLPWMLILRLLGKAVIFDCHENVVASIDDRPWVPRRARRLTASVVGLAVRFLLKPFPVIFAEDSYPAAYPWVKRYAVVRNFPVVGTFPPAAPADRDPGAPFSLVYMGSITKRRGVIDLVEAYRVLRRRGRQVSVTLIGRDDLPAETPLAAFLDDPELRGVRWAGYVPQPEALGIVAGADLGIAVLHPVPNYLGSYPTKLFEYMGCGVPFVTSDFPLYKKLVDEWRCGFVISPGDPQLLADLVEKLMDEPEELRDCGARGRQAIRDRLNWGSEERSLLALYADVTKTQFPALEFGGS